jgi:hypothetical protein
LAMETSADVFAVVVDAAELFAELGSVVDALAVAVFVITVPFGVAGSTWTTMLIGADAPAASVPRLQVTVVVPVHDADAETKVVPAGRASVTVTFWASDGPTFVAVIV